MNPLAINPNIPLVRGHRCLSESVLKDYNIPSEYHQYLSSYFQEVWRKEYIQDKITINNGQEYIRHAGHVWKVILYRLDYQSIKGVKQLKLSFRRLPNQAEGIVLVTTFFTEADTGIHQVSVRSTRNF
jgi:hypothetical protein